MKESVELPKIGLFLFIRKVKFGKLLFQEPEDVVVELKGEDVHSDDTNLFYHYVPLYDNLLLAQNFQQLAKKLRIIVIVNKIDIEEMKKDYVENLYCIPDVVIEQRNVMYYDVVKNRKGKIGRWYKNYQKLNEKEEADKEEWIRKQREKQPDSMTNGIMEDRFILSFHPTGISSAIKVHDMQTGEVKDISDIDSW